jgi:type II secretory pathway pseudopilin PulG
MVTTVRPATPPQRASRDESGFTVLAVLIAVAAINIALGVATVQWSAIMKRQREIELVWRGEQYARALICYQEQEKTLPTELEQLVEARCIRRLYSDPVSKSGRWRVIRAAELGSAAEELLATGTGDPQPDAGSASADVGGAAAPRGLRARLGAGASSQRQGSASGLGSSARQGGLAARLSSRNSGGQSPTEPRGARRSRDDAMEQIVGVVSTSNSEALRTRDGRKRYDEWRFMAGSAPPPSIPTWVPDIDLESMGEGRAEAPRDSPARGLRSRRRGGRMPQ